MKRGRENLSEAGKGLREYTNSPGFKKRMADARKQVEVLDENASESDNKTDGVN